MPATGTHTYLSIKSASQFEHFGIELLVPPIRRSSTGIIKLFLLSVILVPTYLGGLRANDRSAMPGTDDGNAEYRSQTFSARKDRKTLEDMAENRGFDNVSKYLRSLIQNDIQEQIEEGKVNLVPANE